MVSKNRQLWEKEQRRNRIIDQAQEVFFEKGYDGATIEDIAAAADYSKRSIYLYFRDREEIFLAVVLRGQELFHDMLENALNDTGSDGLSIMKLGRAFYQFSINHPEFFSMIMIYESRVHIYYDESEQPGEDTVRARCQRISNRYGALVIRAIDEDAGKGLIKTKLAPRQLMLILWGQIFGVMQIILMRKKMFRDAYGIDHDELFEEFLIMAGKALGK